MTMRPILKVERLPGPGDRTLRYFVRPGSRKGKWLWFDPEDVPPFEGDNAFFECKRVRGGWEVLRQVERPPWR